MDKFEKIHEEFYKILNMANRDLKMRDLKRLFSTLINEYRINLLNSYFKERFSAKSEKLSNVPESLNIIEELNEFLKLYEIVNKTPNAAYDLLVSCNTIDKMRWAVEKMKINPVCFSDKSERHYYLKGPMGTAGRLRSFIRGPYINIFSFSKYENGAYTKLSETNNCNENIALIKKELIYNFMDNPEVLKYLVKCGAGKEIIDKQFDSHQRKEYILNNFYQDMFGMIFVVFLLTYLFLTMSALTLITGLIIGNGLIILCKNSNFNGIKNKFEEMKEYLLKLKAT